MLQRYINYLYTMVTEVATNAQYIKQHVGTKGKTINSFPPNDVMVSHKLMGIYMGFLIPGVIP